jgi:hypothetical protein
MAQSSVVLVATVLITGIAGLTAESAVAATNAPLRVELWGDSLSAQAGDYFRFFMAVSGKASPRAHVFGGTALCDWLPDIRKELDPANKSSFHPQVAVLQFSGNALTTCMQDKNRVAYSGQALVNKYAADAAAAIAMFAKAKIPVYFVSSPLSSAQSKLYTNQTPMGVMLSALPAKFPAGHLVHFVDAATPLEWHGKFSATLPCKSWEKCTGRWPDGTRTVVVRQSDGMHFCPVAEKSVKGVVATCPVPSPGARRFAMVMTGMLALDFHL